MAPKDTFFKKLQPLEDFARLFEKSERFGRWNEKTLGIVLVSNVFDHNGSPSSHGDTMDLWLQMTKCQLCAAPEFVFCP